MRKDQIWAPFIELNRKQPINSQKYFWKKNYIAFTDFYQFDSQPITDISQIYLSNNRYICQMYQFLLNLEDISAI